MTVLALGKDGGAAPKKTGELTVCIICVYIVFSFFVIIWRMVIFKENKDIVYNADKNRVLLDSLLRVPDVPGSLRQALNGDFVKEYFSIMRSRMVIEPDWLLLTGQMSLEQIEQYASLSGDYEVIIEKMDVLADRMVSFYIGRLNSYISNDLAGRHGAGLANLFSSIQRLEGFIPVEYGEMECLYVHLSKLFSHKLMSLLGAKLICMSRSDGCDARVKGFIDSFISNVEKQSREKLRMQFVGVQLFNEMVVCKNALLNKENLRFLDEMIGFRELSDVEKKRISEQNLKACRDVYKEASFKRILFSSVRDAQPQVVLFGDDIIDGHSKYSGFCAFRINFDGGKSVGMPRIVKDVAGNMIYNFELAVGVVNFHLNPYSGELSLITNSGVNLGHILGEDRYLLLKAFLIGRLEDYLLMKDPDIDDIFCVSKPVVSSISDEVGDAVADVVDEYEKWCFCPNEWNKVGDMADEFCAGDVVKSGDVKDGLSSRTKKLIMDKIWGAKGKDVISALKRLLGPCVRRCGSHVFFYSARTNMTLPIPDSCSVAPPLLMDNLNKWGISLLEFARALGWVKGRE